MNIKENNLLGTKTLDKIVKQSPNGIIVAGEDQVIHFINPSAEKLTGVKREVGVGSHMNDIFPQINLQDDKTVRVDINGRDIHIRKFPIIENNEKRTIIIMQDLSNIMKLATELEKTKHLAESLTSILEGSFDGVLVTDGKGDVILVNQSYERVTGLTKEELMGHNMRDMLNPQYMKNSVALLVIEQKEPVSLHHTTKNGRNIIVTGTPIFDSEKKVTKVVINARDISEIYELQQELLKAKEMEKIYFKQLLKNNTEIRTYNNIVVASEKMQNIYDLADRLSSFNTTVMILGESGVGKEEVAKYIHNKDVKRKGHFVTVNCGAIPENLLESELFGYTQGAFTGANSNGKEGLFEAANDGTLFLDEIGELPINLQVKLLRVLETREVTRVGSTVPIPVDVRILVATNRDLEEAVKDKTFREDLYYRLNVVQLKIPPLRKRVEDIAPLAMSFLKKFNLQYGQEKKLTYDVLKEMERYSWPGNIRELKNSLERMVIMSNNANLQILDLPWLLGENNLNSITETEPKSLNETMEELEKKILEEAFRDYPSTRKMAAALKIDQATVVRKLKKYGIKKDED